MSRCLWTTAAGWVAVGPPLLLFFLLLFVSCFPLVASVFFFFSVSFFIPAFCGTSGCLLRCREQRQHASCCDAAMGASESREAQEFFLAHDLLDLFELTKTQARDAAEELVQSVGTSETNVRELTDFFKKNLARRGVLSRGGYLTFEAFFNLLRESPTWQDSYRKADFSAKTRNFRNRLAGSKCGWLIVERPGAGGKKQKAFARVELQQQQQQRAQSKAGSAGVLRFFAKLGALEELDSIPVNSSTAVSINGENDKKFVVQSDGQAILCTAQSSQKSRAWCVHLCARLYLLELLVGCLCVLAQHCSVLRG